MSGTDNHKTKKPSQLYNVTRIDCTIDGNPIVLYGFAHPELSSNDINLTMKEIFTMAHTLISLEGHYDHIKRIFSTYPGAQHYDILIEDFEAPTLEQYQDAYQIVSSSAKDGQNVAVHCRGGYGRTGSILACILLYNLLEKQFKNDPKSFYKYNIDERYAINVAIPSRSNVPCTRAVYECIMQLRNSKGDASNNHSIYPQYVETAEQVTSLVDLEKMIVSEYIKKSHKTPLKDGDNIRNNLQAKL